MVHGFNGLDRTWSTHAPTTCKASWISVSALRVSTYSLAEQVGQERPVIFCKKNQRIAVSIKRLWTLWDINRLPLRCIWFWFCYLFCPHSSSKQPFCRCQTSSFPSKKKTQRSIRLYRYTILQHYTTPTLHRQFLSCLLNWQVPTTCQPSIWPRLRRQFLPELQTHLRFLTQLRYLPNIGNRYGIRTYVTYENWPPHTTQTSPSMNIFQGVLKNFFFGARKGGRRW